MIKKYKKYLIEIGIFSIRQYIIICLILILIYSGGNPFNFDEPDFSWSLNYLSDLGRFHYFNGEKNPFWIFYNLSISIVGIGIIIFFYLLSLLINRRIIKKIIFLFGLLSGIGYTLIGIFPVDLSLLQHVRSGYFGMINFLFAVLLTLLYINKTGYLQIYFLLVFLFTIVLAKIFTNYLTNYMNINKLALLKFKVITQKIVVFSQVFFSIIIFYKLRKQLA